MEQYLKHFFFCKARSCYATGKKIKVVSATSSELDHAPYIRMCHRQHKWHTAARLGFASLISSFKRRLILSDLGNTRPTEIKVPKPHASRFCAQVQCCRTRSNHCCCLALSMQGAGPKDFCHLTRSRNKIDRRVSSNYLLVKTAPGILFFLFLKAT